jgi:hypothetical protein
MANKIVDLTLVADYTPPPDPPEANAKIYIQTENLSANEGEWLVFTLGRTVRTDQVIDVDFAFLNVSVQPPSGTVRFDIGIDAAGGPLITALEVDTHTTIRNQLPENLRYADRREELRRRVLS